MKPGKLALSPTIQEILWLKIVTWESGLISLLFPFIDQKKGKVIMIPQLGARVWFCVYAVEELFPCNDESCYTVQLHIQSLLKHLR